MKKRSIILFFIIPLLLVSCQKKEYIHPHVQAKNIIYIIGDGMGYASIKSGELYSNTTFEFTKWNNYSLYTNSLDGLGFSSTTTDSAAAATALACGVKTKNKRVGIDINGNELETVLDISYSNKKRIGVVTTDAVYGATPAGFSAHSYSRGNTEEILSSQAKTSNLNLIIGCYSSSCKDNKSFYTESGYSYLEKLDKTYYNQDKILINNKNLKPYGDDKSLLDSTKYAIDYLSQNDNGFTLMIEQGHIDKYSHNNDFENMAKSMVELNKTITYLMDYYKNDDDTLIVVTADHETGGLSVWEDENSYKYKYSSKNHTKTAVPLYTNKLIFSSEIAFGTKINNTDLANRIKDIINTQN